MTKTRRAHYTAALNQYFPPAGSKGPRLLCSPQEFQHIQQRTAASAPVSDVEKRRYALYCLRGDLEIYMSYHLQPGRTTSAAARKLAASTTARLNTAYSREALHAAAHAELFHMVETLQLPGAVLLEQIAAEIIENGVYVPPPEDAQLHSQRAEAADAAPDEPQVVFAAAPPAVAPAGKSRSGKQSKATKAAAAAVLDEADAEEDEEEQADEAVAVEVEVEEEEDEQVVVEEVEDNDAEADAGAAEPVVDEGEDEEEEEDQEHQTSVARTSRAAAAPAAAVAAVLPKRRPGRPTKAEAAARIAAEAALAASSSPSSVSPAVSTTWSPRRSLSTVASPPPSSSTSTAAASSRAPAASNSPFSRAPAAAPALVPAKKQQQPQQQSQLAVVRELALASERLKRPPSSAPIPLPPPP